MENKTTKNKPKKVEEIKKEQTEAFKERFNELLDNYIYLGHTQSEFSLDTGISQGAITKYKNGDLPNMYILFTIADYFNVSFNYLIGRSDCPTYTFEDIEEKIGLSQKAIKQLYKFKHNYYPFDEEVDIDITEDITTSDFYKSHFDRLNVMLENSGGLFFLLDNMNKYQKLYEEFENFKSETNSHTFFETAEEKEKIDTYEYRLIKDFLYFAKKTLKEGE